MFVFQCHVKEEATVLLTKVFRNGNSQTVRIPAEIADTNADIALEIERVDDELRIRPVRRSLAGILKKFTQFSQCSVGEVVISSITLAELEYGMTACTHPSRERHHWSAPLGPGQFGADQWIRLAHGYS